jgi:hypothetical protein
VLGEGTPTERLEFATERSVQDLLRPLVEAEVARQVANLRVVPPRRTR